MDSKPFKIIDLDFVVLELHENYVISTIQEGVFFDFPELEIVTNVYEPHFGKNPFVLIANRIYDYTINPTCYMIASKKLNLQGIAIVCGSKSAYETALFEKKFYKNAYESFHTLEEAKAWSETLVEK